MIRSGGSDRSSGIAPTNRKPLRQIRQSTNEKSRTHATRAGGFNPRFSLEGGTPTLWRARSQQTEFQRNALALDFAIGRDITAAK